MEKDREVEKIEKRKKQEKASDSLWSKVEDWGLFSVGVISAIINGSVMPVMAILISEMTTVLTKFEILRLEIIEVDYTEDEVITDSYIISIIFLSLALVAFTVNYLQMDMFNKVGQRVTIKLRNELFTSIINKDMQFFDMEEHNPGVLASKLGKDCVLVNSTVTTVYGAIVQGAASLVVGLAIAYYSSWRLAIIGTIGCPMIIVTGMIESRMMFQGTTDSKKADSEERSLATDVRLFQETCTSMKTINSINCHPSLNDEYVSLVQKGQKSVFCESLAVGLTYGIAQATIQIIFGILFYAGAIFTTDYNLSFSNLFRALYVILFASYGAGMAQNFVPDLDEATKSLQSINQILDYENKVIFPENGKKTRIRGRIEFRDVYFRYPSRDNPVFKRMTFTIEPNQKVAFVGPSGTGKSTIYSLLYRFYDPQNGQILVDGIDIKEYDIKHLRDNLGMVSQEPTLFNSSIEYNIKYNKEFSDQEVRSAAVTANAVNFIESDALDASLRKNSTKSKNQSKSIPSCSFIFSYLLEIFSYRLISQREKQPNGHGARFPQTQK